MFYILHCRMLGKVELVPLNSFKVSLFKILPTVPLWQTSGLLSFSISFSLDLTFFCFSAPFYFFISFFSLLILFLHLVLLSYLFFVSYFNIQFLFSLSLSLSLSHTKKETTHVLCCSIKNPNTSHKPLWPNSLWMKAVTI